ncbi:hypothetical protein C922_05079 [Plasmodium inui San Antonio 1]|uniref:Uncharacterized protein n=1 Tax=Plasmodium inui San Antonio 1 TaxID=1237626 RepID=W6ZUT8_9APIC|nr:hypothetical protein C922_05079 [Plasmodium inui San Antonio 1]EUD64517.1 hypothetical protein C922_05079 [Plasmodium inui San Antonio 1]
MFERGKYRNIPKHSRYTQNFSEDVKKKEESTLSIKHKDLQASYKRRRTNNNTRALTIIIRT